VVLLVLVLMVVVVMVVVVVVAVGADLAAAALAEAALALGGLEGRGREAHVDGEGDLLDDDVDVLGDAVLRHGLTARLGELDRDVEALGQRAGVHHEAVVQVGVAVESVARTVEPVVGA